VVRKEFLVFGLEMMLVHQEGVVTACARVRAMEGGVHPFAKRSVPLGWKLGEIDQLPLGIRF